MHSYLSAEAKKRSIFIQFVDKDSGVELLKEKFPEANEVTVHENKEKEKWLVYILCNNDIVLYLISWFIR